VDSCFIENATVYQCHQKSKMRSEEEEVVEWIHVFVP